MEKWETIIPFLREKFVGTYGIGVKLHRSTPVHLITHVLPHASTRQVRSGDAILKISPNDDGEEIDAVNLSFPELIGHILGEKGTFCRLTVQHLGGDIEEIVMERTATF
jgi:C-terminal processing protease CtpA/Prc